MLETTYHHAIEAVRAAGLFCGRIRKENRIRPLVKADGSPVTNADFGSQALLVSRLRAVSADDPIMAEETADQADFAANAEFTQELMADLKVSGADYERTESLVNAINRIRPTTGDVFDANWRSRYWVIDPIDGTKGYLKGGQYAIALALIENGVVEFGALACPEYPLPGYPESIGVLFTAVRGQGASASPLEGHPFPSVSIEVDSRNRKSGPLMCESLNHSPHGLSGRDARLLAVGEEGIRKMDSQAKYAAVACGDANFYLRLPTSDTYREAVWDHAAGAIIVEESGGTCHGHGRQRSSLVRLERLGREPSFRRVSRCRRV